MKKKIIFDTLVWLVVIGLMTFLVNAPNAFDKFLICLTPIFLFYPHNWILKRYLSEKKVIPYILQLLALVSISTFMLYFAFAKTGGLKSVVGSVTLVCLILFLSTAISYAYKGILLQIQYEKTKRRQVEAELKLLQSQVNPHFLFNTLNNIYAQNLVHPEEANEMILQLADLMRYQIESSKKNEVSIDDEIEFLENYIALEKKRSTDRIKVSFAVEKVDNLTLNIPPMLFIPFIENAYKHGISAEGESLINIFLGITENGISFKLENQIPVRKQTVKSTKTGLDNIKKRLDLLFPNKHQLSIKTDNQIYNVQLDIQI
jgi:LytS/YehU family sensor histidine kinase